MPQPWHPDRLGRMAAGIALAGGALVLALACGGGGGGTSSSQAPAPTTCPITTEPSAPTFSGDVLPAIRSSCGAETSTCHGQGSNRIVFSSTRTASDILTDMESTNGQSRGVPTGWVEVKAGDAANSWIMQKIAPTSGCPTAGSGCVGSQMPLSAPPLCAPTVNTFRDWIQNGATL